MKKGFLTMLATLVCVAACAFAFAACGNNGSANESENGGNQTVAVESVTLRTVELISNCHRR